MFGSTLGYAVYDRHGQQLATVLEVRRDLSTRLIDAASKVGDSRNYHFQVVDLCGNVLLSLRRPEAYVLSSMVVEGPRGEPIGQIEQETTTGSAAVASLAQTGLSLVAGLSSRLNTAAERLEKVDHVRFGLMARGQRLGSIHAEDGGTWDFKIEDAAGLEIAHITKTWAGWATENLTKADNYVVQIHTQLPDPLRYLVVGAALAIDVALKQGNPRHGSRRYT